MPVPAQSYSTPADGDTYFAGRMFTTMWTTATTDQKQAALNQATSIINLFSYVGCKTDPAQPFAFPRKGIVLEGVLLDDSVAPNDILSAQFEIALALLKGIDPEKEIAGIGVTSRGFASVRTTYDSNRTSEHLENGVPSALAWALLYPFFNVNDSGSIDLRRVS